MSNSKSSANTLAYSKVQIENFDITKPEDNERIPAQKLSYVRYKNKGKSGQLYMKTPVIQMISGGIPQEGPFFDNDTKRAKGFKIPFNKATPEEIEFYEKMKELDTYFNSEAFRRDNLGFSDKVSQGFDYVPIVRKPQEKEEDDDEDAPKNDKKKKFDGPRPEYMKSFFELEFQTNKVLVKIYHKKGDEKTLVEDVTTLDDATRYINYMGHYKYIITPNKLYATKNKDQKTGRKSYGVTFKTICIEAEPREQLGGKLELPLDPFISDDEDEDDIKLTSTITKMNLKEVEEIEQIDYGIVDEELVDNNTVLEETVNDEDIIRPKKKTSTLDDGISETKRKGKKNNV
jgi:hypothetical protein